MFSASQEPNLGTTACPAMSCVPGEGRIDQTTTTTRTTRPDPASCSLLLPLSFPLCQEERERERKQQGGGRGGMMAAGRAEVEAPGEWLYMIGFRQNLATTN
uniref:Uncharacterized protein n=1 Tax=Arundo donax TaxID=35708 RepID=A0A0A9DZR9_ARUDO